MGNSNKLISHFNGLKTETRIVILGLDNAGKSTILKKLEEEESAVGNPGPIGFYVEEIQYKNLNIYSWDLGGSDKMRILWKHFYEGTHALIYVVDANDSDRITEANVELHKLLDEEQLKDVTLLVYANKQDLPNAMPMSELVHKLDLSKVKQNWTVQPCCATTEEGLVEGILYLNKHIIL
jgi:small GTP-binding protein